MKTKSSIAKTAHPKTLAGRFRTACAASLLPLLLLLTLPAVVQAQFNFTTNNGAITITRYTGSGGDVIIPDTINGLPVTSIGYEAFDDCFSLTSVTICTNVTTIGDEAFFYCSSLANVTIPNSVTSIGDYAFDDCFSLTNVTIGNSVTTIWPDTFGDCWRLSAFTVDTLNPVYSSVAGVLFNKNQTTLILYPPGKARVYTIPNSVTTIGSMAFYGCESLTSVTIGNSVTNIGVYAFYDCGLTSVTIPNSVISIAGGAFEHCFSLTSITISTNVTTIGYEAFSGCNSLTAITVDMLNSFYSSVNGVLFNKSTNTLIQCPGGKAGAYTIPNSVTSIGNSAFLDCYNLTSVIIGNSVTSIGYEAFCDCHNLTNVTIDNSVTNIGEGAFEDCASLTSVTIPNSITSLGSGVFSSCIRLTSVTIPNSVTSIGYAAFSDCYSLSNVMIGTSVTSIGDGAFSGCESLTSVTIPDCVTSIGYAAFSDCYSLSNVMIGTGITSIGDYAFNSCASLTSIYFKGNAPSLGSYVFYGDDNVTLYYLPGMTGWDTTFDVPTALWTPQMQSSDASFGVRTNQFGFNINWASGQTVVVEASTDLANPTWFPLQTNTLTADSCYFSDPQWTNYPGRFYRLRSP